MFDLKSKSLLAGVLAGATLLTSVAIQSEALALTGDGHHSGGHKNNHHRKDRADYSFYYKGDKYYCKNYYDREPGDRQHGYYHYCVSKDYQYYYSKYDENYHREYKKDGGHHNGGGKHGGGHHNGGWKK